MKKEEENNNEIPSIIRSYMNEASKYKFLSKQEQLELLTKAKNNDTEAKNALLFSNFFHVLKIAKKYQSDRHDLKLEDLVNEGFIGISKAISKFDPSKNVSFLTYATPWINAEITREIENTGTTIRLPVDLNQTLLKVRKKRDEYMTLNGSYPTDEELAAISKVNIKVIKKIKNYVERPLSLNAFNIDDEEVSYDKYISSEILCDESSYKREIERKEYLDVIEKNLHYLTEKEKKILIYRYGIYGIDKLSTSEIAKVLNTTSNAIGTYERRAIDKIRNANGLENKKYPRGRRRVK